LPAIQIIKEIEKLMKKEEITFNNRKEREHYLSPKRKLQTQILIFYSQLGFFLDSY